MEEIKEKVLENFGKELQQMDAVQQTYLLALGEGIGIGLGIRAEKQQEETNELAAAKEAAEEEKA